MPSHGCFGPCSVRSAMFTVRARRVQVDSGIDNILKYSLVFHDTDVILMGRNKKEWTIVSKTPRLPGQPFVPDHQAQKVTTRRQVKPIVPKRGGQPPKDRGQSPKRRRRPTKTPARPKIRGIYQQRPIQPSLTAVNSLTAAVSAQTYSVMYWATCHIN